MFGTVKQQMKYKNHGAGIGACITEIVQWRATEQLSPNKRVAAMW